MFISFQVHVRQLFPAYWHRSKQRSHSGWECTWSEGRFTLFIPVSVPVTYTIRFLVLPLTHMYSVPDMRLIWGRFTLFIPVSVPVTYTIRFLVLSLTHVPDTGQLRFTVLPEVSPTVPGFYNFCVIKGAVERPKNERMTWTAVSRHST